MIEKFDNLGVLLAYFTWFFKGVITKCFYFVKISRRKQFQRQLTVPPLKQTLVCNTYVGEKHFKFFLKRTYFK